jgi:TetR/AcrR family transcriptional regulator, transcriptional repressor for nem operon
METGTDTRQRLIDSARELIYARSYSDVGVQQICERAGVKKGSFYHFFPSKRDLTLAALDQLHTYFRQHIIDVAFAADIPPLERFKRFISASYEFHKQLKENTGHIMGCPFGNLGCELSTQDEVIRKRVDSIFSEVQQPLATALAEAVANGELPDIDTAAAARAIFAYIEGVMMYAKIRNDPELIRELGARALYLACAPTGP